MMLSLKYKIVAVMVLLTACLPLSAQTTIAKIKYEQAEQAYADGDYKTALKKTQETEDILKSSNPKTLYLKVMSQFKLLDTDDQIIRSLKRDAQDYIARYDGIPELEDKFRDVYLVYEQISSIDDSDEALAKKAEAVAAAKAKADAEKQKSDALISVSESLMAKYGFKLVTGTDGKVVMRIFHQEFKGEVEQRLADFNKMVNALAMEVPRELVEVNTEKKNYRNFQLVFPKSDKYPAHRYAFTFSNFKKKSFVSVSLLDVNPQQTPQQTSLPAAAGLIQMISRQ